MIEAMALLRAAVLVGLMVMLMSACTAVFPGLAAVSNRGQPSVAELQERCLAAEREARRQLRTPLRCRPRPVARTSVGGALLVGVLVDVALVVSFFEVIVPQTR